MFLLLALEQAVEMGQVEDILHERDTLRRVWLCLTTPLVCSFPSFFFESVC